jgi:hypothetical protein
MRAKPAARASVLPEPFEPIRCKRPIALRAHDLRWANLVANHPQQVSERRASEVAARPERRPARDHEPLARSGRPLRVDSNRFTIYFSTEVVGVIRRCTIHHEF